MRRRSARSAALLFAALFIFSATSLCAAQTAAAVAQSARVRGPVSSGQTVRLSHHVPAYADVNEVPSTAMAPTAKLAHMTLMMNRSAEVQAAFEQLLADQVNPASPRFHQWLMPAQVGTLYGPAQADVDAVTSWLQGRGLTVNSISPNRLFVDFSGPVASVESAFSTSFRVFSLANGEQRYSLTQEPAIPAALQPVVATVAGLSQALHYSTAHRGERVTPRAGAAGGEQPALNSTTGNHYLVSGDFAVAYNLNPVYNSGITGTGQNIAVVGESRVNTSDIAALQALEGMPTKQANVIIPPAGTDPGMPGDTSGTESDAQDEATLDVNRTLGTAPGATVDLVVSGDIGAGNTFATSGLYIAISYAINTVNDPILSISFGGCESLNGQANTTYEQSIFQTAASQGISTFISSGDSGAAACNAFYTTIPTTQVLNINDLCSNQYVTCVGGTQFADTASPSTYWSSTNGANNVSLLSYIPEGAWNEVSVSSAGKYTQGATGGGVSIYLPKPTWQTGTGVPAGNFRYVPDVSFTSSGHDGFVTCLSYLKATCGAFYAFGGTSAAAPSMAGIQALVNQKLGARQGNINPTVYTLGNAGAAFHDTTVASSGVSSCAVTTPSLCNNSTPTSTSLTGGLAGYLVTAGWDASTGWGSLDVAKYLAAVVGVQTPTFTVTPASTALTLISSAGATVTDTITVASVNSFSGATALSCAVTTASGTAAGTCSLSPTSTTLASGGTGTSTLTITNGTSGAAGTLNVSVTATNGTTSVTSSTITVVVSGPTFSITPATTTPALASSSGGLVTDALTIASVNTFAGTVGLTCKVTTTSGTAAGTCTVSPASVTLASGGTGSSTVTINSNTVGTTGVLSVLVTGTSGNLTVASTLTVNVTAPTFTITSAPSSLSFTSGAASGNSTALTLASAGSFAGTVGLSCTLTTSSAAFQPTCAVSPASVSLAAGGTGSATLTIGSTTARSAATSGGLVTAMRGWSAGGASATLALLLCCAPLRRRRRGFAGLAVLCLSLVALTVLSGCSDNSGTTNIPTMKSSAGTYTVTVSGTGTTSGGTSATSTSATVTVTIN